MRYIFLEFGVGSDYWRWNRQRLNDERAAALSTNWPKITIITVTYNAEATLQRTIDSVRVQDYPNLEYIIVDGASTDSTLDIINKNADIISVSHSAPDEGCHHAFSIGGDLATGDLVQYLNGDDRLEEGALRAVGNAWKLDPSVDLITLPIRVIKIDEDGRERTTRAYSPGECELTNWHLIKGWPQTNARFMARKLLIQHLPLRYKLPDGRHSVSADLEIWLRMQFDVRNQITLPGPYYVYTAHDGSLTFNEDPVRQLSLVRETIFTLKRFLKEESHRLPLWQNLATRAYIAKRRVRQALLTLRTFRR